MKFMLYTNICIHVIKHRLEAVLRNFLKHDPYNLCISSVIYAELMHGVEKSQDIERNRVAILNAKHAQWQPLHAGKHN